MPDAPKVLVVPAAPFTFGDQRYRALYGPETPSGARPVVGVIREDHVSLLEGELEKALAVKGSDV